MVTGDDCWSKFCLSNIPPVKYLYTGAMSDPVPEPLRAALNDPRLTLMGLFAEAFAGVMAKQQVALARHGLPEAEFGALLRLARSPGGRLRMTDLTAQMSLTSSGITRLVDRLVERGLVCREACPADRRSTFAVITSSGLHRIEAASAEHLELIERWLISPLSDEQRPQLEAALRAVRDAVRPDATAGADGAGLVPNPRPDPR